MCRSVTKTFCKRLTFSVVRLPILLAAALLMFDKDASTHLNDRNPNFIYGASQAIVSVSLLVLCFIGRFPTPLIFPL